MRDLDATPAAHATPRAAAGPPVAVLAGASGFIGGWLLRELRADGYQVRVIGRTGPDAVWGDKSGMIRVLDGVELLINLAGKSVNCRYTEENGCEPI